MRIRSEDVAMLCDFDGTITQQDVGLELVRQFSTADWEAIEEPFTRGEVGILENMRTQFSHVPHGAPELVKYARSITTIRPGWEEFVAYCRRVGLELAVLSGGLDFYIDALLPQPEPKLIVHALHAEYTDGSWRVWLPSARDATEEQVEFKRSVVEQYERAGKLVWFAGNGSSDRGAARAADRVWALEPLLTYCRQNGILARPFETFHDIQSDVERLLAGMDIMSAREQEEMPDA